MSPKPDAGARSKAERGRMAVLSLMTLYLVLAVAVGVARNQMQISRPGASAAFVAQAGAPYR